MRGGVKWNGVRVGKRVREALQRDLETEGLAVVTQDGERVDPRGVAVWEDTAGMVVVDFKRVRKSPTKRVVGTDVVTLRGTGY